MRRQNRIILIAMLIIILLMGIAYATISNIPLTINGEATATWDNANFTPHFTIVKRTEVVKGPPGNLAQVDATINTDTTRATVDIRGLSTKGDNAYAILQIVNQSADITAKSISVTATGTNTSMFTISAVMCDENGNTIIDYEVASNDYTYVKVSATLLHTAITEESTTIDVTVTAVPKNPTE